MQAYVICTLPRSGSTLLCHLLRATGVAGWPGSHFHVTDLSVWRRHLGLTADATLDEIFRAGRKLGQGDTDVFGLRLQPRSRRFFHDQLQSHVPGAISDRAAFEAVFGPASYIFLKRDNVLAQAVSLHRAIQSGLWHKAPDGTEIERQSEAQEPVYDRAALTKQIAEFEQAAEDWRAWFEAEGIRPLELTYSDLADDPLAVLQDVLEYLGLPEDAADDVDVPTAKLADAINAEWIARYSSGR